MAVANTRKAYVWSILTEILSKIITPVINMILARLLLPEDFGILATIMMVIQFAEVFVESGFQKVLIQRKFESQKQECQYMSVALWTSLILSFGMWGGIILFRNKIACVVGNCTLGVPIAVTGVMIPLYAVVGMWNCKFRKDLDFRSLFPVRICSAFVPLFVTVPLALMGCGYWSLIIGNVCGLAVRFGLLTIRGKFKPQLCFSIKILKDLFSDGIWTLLDGIAVWFTSWVDALLISRYMSDYYVGLYKNTSSTVMSLFAIITASITPVLFSSLSKVQTQKEEFDENFFGVQKLLFMFLTPISVGVFLYRDFATIVLFGEAWIESANIIGITAITIVMRSILVSIYSDVFRAKGKFYWPLIMQCLDIIIIISVCLPAVKRDFWEFVYLRAFVRLDLIIPTLLVAKKVCNLSPVKSLKGAVHPICATIVMSVCAILLQRYSEHWVWNLISIAICAIVYLLVLCLFKDERNMVRSFGKKISR